MVGGLALIAVPLAALASRWSAILASHPAYLITLAVIGVIGVVTTWTATRPPRSTRRGAREIVCRVALAAVVVTACGALWALRPVAATTVAVEAMNSDSRVQVSTTTNYVNLTPTDPTHDVGLIFYPGGLVEPRAYAHLLRQIAEDGYPVVIVKPPFGIAFLSGGAAATIAADRPDVQGWVVAGHSLGGVVAAGNAAGQNPSLAGLVLWASYPNESLAERSDLAVASIWGSNDGSTTAEDIQGSRRDLPAATSFVEVAGGIHAFFGDYGPQRGDGTPGVSRATAQADILAATRSLLREVE